MAVGNVGLATRHEARTKAGFKTFLSRYFYLCMSLVLVTTTGHMKSL